MGAIIVVEEIGGGDVAAMGVSKMSQYQPGLKKGGVLLCLRISKYRYIARGLF